MSKQSSFAALLVICSLSANAKPKEVTVWENPVVESYINQPDGFEVTRIEFKDDETTVHIHSTQDWYETCFTSYSYIQSEDGMFNIDKTKNVLCTSPDTVVIDGHYVFGGVPHDMVLHFEPMPKTTKCLSIYNGRLYQNYIYFLNVRDREVRKQMITPSRWVDEDSNSWAFGLFEDYAIYDKQIWDYGKKISEKNGNRKYSFDMKNGERNLKVTVGKMKNDRRRFVVTDRKSGETVFDKQLLCLIDRQLPDFTTPDETAFDGTILEKPDTATIVGVLRGMDWTDLHAGDGWGADSSKTLSIVYDGLTNEAKEVFADLDSLGRFTIKIPLRGTSVVDVDCPRGTCQSILEPGKTYFFLHDYRYKQTMYMGEDCRLQNEMIKYKMPSNVYSLGYSLYQKGYNLDNAIDTIRLALKKQQHALDSIVEICPVLSKRYKDFAIKNNKSRQNMYMLNGMYGGSGELDRKKFTDFALQQLNEKFDPVTLYYSQGQFYSNFLSCEANRRLDVYVTDEDMVSQKYVKLDDGDLATLRELIKKEADLKKEIEAEKDSVKRVLRLKEFNEANADETALQNKVSRDVANTKIYFEYIKNVISLSDSLRLPRPYVDNIIYNLAKGNIEGQMSPLPQLLLDEMACNIENPETREQLVAANFDMMEKVRQAEKLTLEGLRSNDIVKGLTDGEQILKTILEPLKGRYVYLDVWGTWCGPCRQALSHSEEEYRALEPYNVAFLYLANNSPETAWKTIINDSKAYGKQCFHYNLPAEQQSAVEKFMKIRAFPTFFVIDKEGNILDIKSDPRSGVQKLVEIFEGLEHEK